MDKPKPSLPPPEPVGRVTFYHKLLQSSDGLWYLLADYATPDAARQIKWKLIHTKRRAPGTWEYQHGPVPDSDRFGVWARNLDGPLVGTDEQGG